MLEQIVIAILALTLINAVSLYKVRDDLHALLKINEKWARKPQAETDLDLGKYDEVIARCLKDINDNPRHAKAHWYLGKAYYDKGMCKEAREQMELLARLQPSWRAEFTEPYVQEIDSQLKTTQEN
jgi:tetratricopeptide (TPR) repeat protein